MRLARCLGCLSGLQSFAKKGLRTEVSLSLSDEGQGERHEHLARICTGAETAVAEFGGSTAGEFGYSDSGRGRGERTCRRTGVRRTNPVTRGGYSNPAATNEAQPLQWPMQWRSVMAAQPKDVDIVELLRAEPKSGFEVLYRAYAERLFAYCTTVLRDRDSAADASHECLVAAVTKIDSLRSAERLRPWLFAIARNECFKLLRGKSREVTNEEAIDMQSTSPDLAADVTSSESQQLVYEALESLAPADRDVLALALRKDLDPTQVAEAMEMSSNQVRARLSRARTALTGAVSALVLVRDKKAECPDLAEIVSEGDSEFTPLLRKRISRHIKECETCEEASHTKALSYVSAFTLPLALILPKGFEAKAMESVNELMDHTLGQSDDVTASETETGIGTSSPDPSSGSDLAGGLSTTTSTGVKKVALSLVAASTVAAGIFAFGALVPVTDTVQPNAQQAGDLVTGGPAFEVDAGSSADSTDDGAQRGQGKGSESGSNMSADSDGDRGTEVGESGSGSGKQSSGSGDESGRNSDAVGGQGSRDNGNSSNDQSTGNGSGAGKERGDTGDTVDRNGEDGGTTDGGKEQGRNSDADAGNDQRQGGNAEDGKGPNTSGEMSDEDSDQAPGVDLLGTVSMSASPGSLAGCPFVKWTLSAYTKGGPAQSVVVYYGGAASGKVALAGGGNSWSGSIALPQGIYKFYAVAVGAAGNKVQSATQSRSVKCPPADTQQPNSPSPKISKKSPSPKFSSPKFSAKPNLGLNQG